MLSEQFINIDIVGFAKLHNFALSPNTCWAWKRTNNDGTTRNNFQWPHKFGGIVEEIGPDDDEPCGSGLHLAKNVEGASQGGNLVSAIGLIVAYNPEDILGEDDNKVRVCRCLVLPGNFDIISAVVKPGSDLFGADLGGANLNKMYLSRTNFSSAYLWGADFSEAYLNRANFSEAYLRLANFSGADLSGANLGFTNFSDAKYNKSTVWPVDFDPEKAGAILTQ